MPRYTLVLRLGSRVDKERFGSLDEALNALAERIPSVSRREPVRALTRDYHPVRQVAGRLELRGPRVRGGVDVRGDGSAEAYVGWIRKRLVELEPGESPVDGLRRVLAGSA
jgi:hypothetical protein